jgi:hypothetical protein
MKKILASVLIVLSVTSCGAWWQQFKSDPLAVITTFIQRAEIVLQTAETIFQTILPLIPAAQQATVQVDFQKADLAAKDSLSALQDAEQTAADVQQNPPDFSKAEADVTNAIGQVIAIIDEFKTGSSRMGGAHDVPSYQGLKTHQAALHK